MPSRISIAGLLGRVLLVGAAGCAAPVRAPHTPAPRSAALEIRGRGDPELARALSASLIASCPDAAPGDLQARQRCADRLTHDAGLQGRMGASLLWGAQSTRGSYDLRQSQTTRFDPLVFRRMYLSTFMFSGPYRVEHAGKQLVVRMPVHFRNAMDPGEYPYPFWHSEAKWRSYQQTRELLFFLEAGRLVAVLRAAELDGTRAVVSHECVGCVQWQSDGGGRTRVALYQFMFSPDNPHVAAVDRTYRAFELAQRRVDCMSCHNPGNPSQMNPLELFSYPNQALSARHTIVHELEHNQMPPATKEAPAGIADERYRQALLGLAREFAAAGDRALEFEARTVSFKGPAREAARP
jgi:hypothetical protein